VEQRQLLTDGAEVLGPFVAPMARDAGSVVEELADLEIARAVVECCCQPDAAGGLTLAEIAARIDGAVDPRELEHRLNVFVGLGMLQPYEDRRGTGRYVLDPRGLAGVQVAERITTQGGVSELLLLLDRTASAIRASAATAVEVRAALERARLFFSLFADTLARKTRLGTITELYDEVRGHEHQRLLVTLDELTKLVAGTFGELEPLAHATLLEAQRYDRWLGQAAERVVAEAGAARDFGVLSPEAWRTAAIHAPWEGLSEVARMLVFDAPAPVVSAEQLLEALAHWRPTPRQRQLPPEPQLSPGPNPLELQRRRREQRRERLTLQAESLLQGEPSVDLTDTLRAMPWSAAAQLLADTLASGRDPVVSIEVVIGDGLLADPVLEVAWCSTPLTLSRNGSSTATVESSERVEVHASDRD
jgi:hypothetical protein